MINGIETQNVKLLKKRLMSQVYKVTVHLSTREINFS